MHEISLETHHFFISFFTFLQNGTKICLHWIISLFFNTFFFIIFNQVWRTGQGRSGRWKNWDLSRQSFCIFCHILSEFWFNYKVLVIIWSPPTFTSARKSKCWVMISEEDIIMSSMQEWPGELLHLKCPSWIKKNWNLVLCEAKTLTKKKWNIKSFHEDYFSKVKCDFVAGRCKWEGVLGGLLKSAPWGISYLNYVSKKKYIFKQ